MKIYKIDDDWAGWCVIIANSPEDALKYVPEHRWQYRRRNGNRFSDNEMILLLKDSESEIREGIVAEFFGDS